MTEFQSRVLDEIRHHNETFGWGFMPKGPHQKRACKVLVAAGECEERTGNRYTGGFWVKA